jgi:hypothetical protein
MATARACSNFLKRTRESDVRLASRKGAPHSGFVICQDEHKLYWKLLFLKGRGHLFRNADVRCLHSINNNAYRRRMQSNVASSRDRE